MGILKEIVRRICTFIEYDEREFDRRRSKEYALDYYSLKSGMIVNRVLYLGRPSLKVTEVINAIVISVDITDGTMPMVEVILLTSDRIIEKVYIEHAMCDNELMRNFDVLIDENGNIGNVLS